ncbi:hypothetical protein COLO4_03458 [Corchorus olitorius]|uniref:Uncharacterized protein n=1 Tax=Corchorus olitorius TaxID=93759 RepID=A0A1R3KYL6_9ROSI|nr:hypothetical protein COLO4_03458 [Corchorus olitorius]
MEANRSQRRSSNPSIATVADKGTENTENISQNTCREYQRCNLNWARFYQAIRR